MIDPNLILLNQAMPILSAWLAQRAVQGLESIGAKIWDLLTTHKAKPEVLQDAQANPAGYRLSALQTELERLVETDPTFRQQLQSLLPATDSSVTQTAIGHGNIQVAGSGNKVER